MSKGQTKAEIAAEKLKKQRANQKPLSYSAAPTTGLGPMGPAKPAPMKLEDTFFSTSKANKPAKSQSKVSAPKRPASEKAQTVMQGIGTKQVESPTGFKTSDFVNLQGITKNFSQQSINPKKTARKVQKSIKQQERTENKISRLTSRQEKRVNRAMKEESRGMDSSVTKSKIEYGAKRLNKLRNK